MQLKKIWRAIHYYVYINNIEAYIRFAMELKFFNTLERRIMPFVPLEEGRVGMYTCGPTVYNYAHIGNFRAYAFEDLLHRVLAYAGYKVTQVMNLTDVDDKTIRDSRKEQKSLKEFTQKYIDAFFADLKTLNITPAAVYPAATGHIKEMIELIQSLLDKEYAYQAEDKSIYFSIDKFPKYGELAKIDRENQRSGVRVSTDEYAKDSVADFALWKAYDQNDGEVFWESPWGKGRPGWHIECSAMAMKYLGQTFDIHTGGIDNMFPHHEDEIAQSECANGCKYVNYWLHCAHLMVNGEKMSKSLGNFYTLRDLLERGYTGREIRSVLLGAHYRKKLNFTQEALDSEKENIKYFDELFIRLKEWENQATDSLGEALLKGRADFENAISDDLNAAGAKAAVYDFATECNRRCDQKTMSSEDAVMALDLFRVFDLVFGFLNVDDAKRDEIPQEIVDLAEARQAARRDKKWTESDLLRDQLKVQGYVVEDVAGGTFRIKKI